MFLILRFVSAALINYLISLLTPTSNNCRNCVNPGGINSNLALCLSNYFDKSGSKWVVALSMVSKELETLFLILLANHILLSQNINS